MDPEAGGAAAAAEAAPAAKRIPPYLPKNGLVYSEKAQMAGVLCRPKILAIKPASTYFQKDDDDDNDANR
ncbi:hypothetical protein M885DRAFT_542507 [Pelagophyceae sp. CCMP2097]|nr:hypothetical protein M885DRAFT_542507 [Pelagophyceae sp. CCMP2097]